LVDHRVLHIVVDDVDTTGARARQHETRERVCQRRRRRRKDTIHRIEQKLRWNKENITGTHFDRKRASVETAFECLNLERHTGVVNSVTSMNARLPVIGGKVEPDARRKVVLVSFSLALQKRQDQRVQFIDAAYIFHVGVELVTQTEIQS